MPNPTAAWTPEQRAQLVAEVDRQLDAADAETLDLMRQMFGLAGLPDTRDVRMAMLLGAALALINEGAPS